MHNIIPGLYSHIEWERKTSTRNKGCWSTYRNYLQIKNNKYQIYKLKDPERHDKNSREYLQCNAMHQIFQHPKKTQEPSTKS